MSSSVWRVAAVVACWSAVTLCFTGSPAHEQTATPAWPGARGGAHAMAFDERRGLTMLYGDRGADATRLWAWDGTRWRSFDSPGPGLRRHIKLAYDPARDRLVLYGGYDDSGLDIRSDTWEWDGEQWRRVPVQGPGPRSSYALVYDPERKKILLFGGLSAAGPKGDTWTWDGQEWIKIADDGPSPRGEAGVVYDPRTRRVLLAGGMAYRLVTLKNGRTTFNLQRDQMPRDTWALDESTWRLVWPGTAARMAPLARDPRTGDPIRVAGESDDGVFHGDLWRWTAGEWRLVPDAQIPARHGPAVASDTRRSRLVLFGGSTSDGKPQSDLWEWDGERWRQIAAPVSGGSGVAPSF